MKGRNVEGFDFTQNRYTPDMDSSMLVIASVDKTGGSLLNHNELKHAACIHTL